MTYATLCTCGRLQFNKMPGHNVLCGVARRGGQQKVNFLLLYRIFPSFPHAREKSGMFRENTINETGKNSVAGAGPLGPVGRSGPERSGPGWWAGPGPDFSRQSLAWLGLTGPRLAQIGRKGSNYKLPQVINGNKYPFMKYPFTTV